MITVRQSQIGSPWKCSHQGHWWFLAVSLRVQWQNLIVSFSIGSSILTAILWESTRCAGYTKRTMIHRRRIATMLDYHRTTAYCCWHSGGGQHHECWQGLVGRTAHLGYSSLTSITRISARALSMRIRRSRRRVLSWCDAYAVGHSRMPFRVDILSQALGVSHSISTQILHILLRH